MKVVWTVAAQKDLEGIADYIAAHHPVRAVSFINEITAAGDALAETPNAFPIVPQLESRAIRRKIYRDYLIFLSG